MLFASSGGTGDCLLVSALKINKDQYKHMHFEKHECHKKPCEDIMSQFTDNYEFVLSKNPDEDAKKAGKYISTNIVGVIEPYLKKRIENGFYTEHDCLMNYDYIVIQMTSGRLEDDTKRGFHTNIIKDIRNQTDKTIVLIGPERIGYDGENVMDFTGQTESIIDAFSIINGACAFIGMDGVCSYYSLMLKIPTIIFYHIPILVNHYYNQSWDSHSMAFHSGNWVDRLPNNSQIRNIIDTETKI